MRFHISFFVLSIAFLAFCLVPNPGQAQNQFIVEEITTELNEPWGLAFLPNGDMLVTEHGGHLRLIKNGVLQPTPIAKIDGVLKLGQGGLFDVVLHPDFADNQLIYLSFATGRAAQNATKIIRARFTGTGLENIETIYVSDMRSRPAHYGGRFVFLADKTLVLTLGDSFDEREKAQDPSNTTGSLIRITDTGGIPEDNPFIGQSGIRPETYSYGHRNPQAIVYDKAHARIYANEHGPKGGDELNEIDGGRNYGWPVITYGLDYSGARITPYTKMPNMEQPLTYWTPSIAPSGMAIYDGTAFADWQGDLLVTSLVFDKLVRVDMDNDAAPSPATSKVKGQEDIYIDNLERLRDVRVGPDGYIYILAELPEGKLVRLIPNNNQVKD